MSKTPDEPLAEAAELPQRFRFRLVHVAYAVTVLAASIATFGSGGIMLGILVCAFWAAVFTSRSRPVSLLEYGLVVIICLCLLSLVLPAISPAREAARRMQCANNLKQISLALHDYHDVYGSFPPAYVTDASGRPMHSWRVLLLPFLEQQPLYEQYRFDEPWDGPHNRTLLSKIPPPYSCPSTPAQLRHPTMTSYVAVVDSTTVWPGESTARFNDVKDGTANTVLVVEFSGAHIPWMAPRDLNLEQAIESLTAGDSEFGGNHLHETFFYYYFRGRNIAMVDSAVHFAPHGVERATWSATLGKDDGLLVSADDFDVPQVVVKRIKVGNCIRLGLFLLICLFPLPWVWRHPTPT